MNTITNEQHLAKFDNLQLVLQLAGTKLRKASGQWGWITALAESVTVPVGCASASWP